MTDKITVLKDKLLDTLIASLEPSTSPPSPQLLTVVLNTIKAFPTDDSPVKPKALSETLKRYQERTSQATAGEPRAAH